MAPPSREFGASINPGAAHRAKHIGLHKLRRGAHGTDWTTPHGHRYTVIPHNTAPPSQLERTFLDHDRAHGTPSKLRR